MFRSDNPLRQEWVMSYAQIEQLNAWGVDDVGKAER